MRNGCRSSLNLKLRALLNRSFLLSFFLLLAGSSGHAQSGGAIALVQHASKDAGSTTSSALAFGKNNTAGNWIAVCVRAGALNETVLVADSKRNTYRNAIQFNQTVDGFTYAIYYAENVAGGANTVTVSDTVSGILRFAILEYSGVAISGSLDVTAMAQGRSASPSTSPSVNTTVNGDLLLGAIMTGNPAKFTPGPGYVIEESVPGVGREVDGGRSNSRNCRRGFGQRNNRSRRRLGGRLGGVQGRWKRWRILSHNFEFESDIRSGRHVGGDHGDKLRSDAGNEHRQI